MQAQALATGVYLGRVAVERIWQHQGTRVVCPDQDLQMRMSSACT